MQEWNKLLEGLLHFGAGFSCFFENKPCSVEHALYVISKLFG